MTVAQPTSAEGSAMLSKGDTSLIGVARRELAGPCDAVQVNMAPGANEIGVQDPTVAFGSVIVTELSVTLPVFSASIE